MCQEWSIWAMTKGFFQSDPVDHKDATPRTHTGSSKTRLCLSFFVACALGMAGCTPDRGQDKDTPEEAYQTAASHNACANPPDLVHLPDGAVVMGAAAILPEEGPPIRLQISAFAISSSEITNAQFAAFVADTGYITQAERKPDPAMHPDIPADLLTAGSAVFSPPKLGENAFWWRFQAGANWRHPTGPGSSIDDRDNYPVVHIAKEDAERYAAWRGCRLPSEAEWEYAARGGLEGARYDWGEDGAERVKRANTWQGIFPVADSGDDGFTGLAPVACFPANGNGLYDMTGNAWEWVADSDPGFPANGLVKGGSYLCSDNFCARFRPAARQSQETDFSASHIGFRIVCDLE
jgi:formylglycine-generating enzyme